MNNNIFKNHCFIQGIMIKFKITTTLTEAIPLNNVTIAKSHAAWDKVEPISKIHHHSREDSERNISISVTGKIEWKAHRTNQDTLAITIPWSLEITLYTISSN